MLTFILFVGMQQTHGKWTLLLQHLMYFSAVSWQYSTWSNVDGMDSSLSFRDMSIWCCKTCREFGKYNYCWMVHIVVCVIHEVRLKMKKNKGWFHQICCNWIPMLGAVSSVNILGENGQFLEIIVVLRSYWSAFAPIIQCVCMDCVVVFVLFFNKEKMFMFMSQCQTKLSGI